MRREPFLIISRAGGKKRIGGARSITKIVLSLKSNQYLNIGPGPADATEATAKSQQPAAESSLCPLPAAVESFYTSRSGAAN